MKKLSSTQKAYLAGFLDGDGSIYVQAKPNVTYRHGFQIAPYIVFFQSQKDEVNFRSLCSLIGFGTMRTRKDGILEYIIGKHDEILKFLEIIDPYVILKKEQVVLMRKILDMKKKVETKDDFLTMLNMIDAYRELNYSKKRKVRTLIP